MRAFPLALLVAAAAAGAPALAQPDTTVQTVPVPRLPQDDSETAPAPTPVVDAAPLTLDDAIAIALERGYAVRSAELDVANAQAQVRQAYGTLYPQVSASSSYTRNVVQANPFAGSSAGNIFSGLGAIGWLQFNETARTDGDPATVPITLEEYFGRVAAGQEAAGFVQDDGANPFGTDNQFQNSLSISQTLYSGAAFAAVRGARSLVDINRAAVAQREDEIIHQVRTAYYGALLAQEQVRVLAASARRAQATQDDIALFVAQGIRPKLDRLNAEVDAANAETQLVQARAQAQTAEDQLLFTIGLPVDAPVRLDGALRPPEDELFRTASADAALDAAVTARPDLEQARLAVQLQGVQRDITRSASFPTLSAFANLGYSGNVPDNRDFLVNPDPTDPFTFETGSSGFFSESYWQPSVSVGLRASWTLFDGFQTRYRVQQDQVAIDKAEIALAQATEAARLEVSTALRQMGSAQRRLATQRQTVETAETAFAFAEERLDVGAAGLLDVRVATQNLDVARLNYLQAVFDALVARSDFERATGAIAPAPVAAPPSTTTASR